MILTTHQKLKILSTPIGSYCPEFGGILSKCYCFKQFKYYGILVDQFDLLKFCKENKTNTLYRDFVELSNTEEIINILNTLKFNGFNDWEQNDVQPFNYGAELLNSSIVLGCICRKLFI
jgi:hypothetical protein